MRVGDRFHLTYCSNIHPGETWAEVQAALAENLPQVRRHLGFDGPFAIGLRLSAAAAVTLEQPGELERFRAFLRDGGYYVFTINGFPYGAFHGTRVKEQVYLPDWRDERRLEYSNRLARVLAALLPEGLDGTVSTVPGAFKPALAGKEDVRRMTTMLLRHVAELVAIREETGRTISLVLEPEPACFLETTAEAVDYFRSWLFNPVVVRRVSDSLPRRISVDEVRRHLGICFDACHMAVQFEDVASSLDDFRDAGITIGKFQLSSGLRVKLEGADAAAAAALKPFADDTYFHQVVEHTAGDVTRFVDLPEALATLVEPAKAGPHDEPFPSDVGAGFSRLVDREWRVHFHLPIYMDKAPGIDTTSNHLEELLALLRTRDVCRYLEVETYTWSVLAPQYKTADLPAAIAKELAWVRDRLV